MYTSTPFVDPLPRAPGFHDTRCRVTWAARGSDGPLTIIGDYLDADSPGGAITLGCGIEMALAHLGIEFLDHGHLLAVCGLVDRQLAEHPWAALRCPQGTARIELVPRADPLLPP